MLEKQCLDILMVNIDKIIIDEPTIPFDCEHCSEEYNELILLAQFLKKADYATESGRHRVWQNIQKNKDGEIEDEDLDMVAGGVNLQMLDEKNKKNGL